jgi:hypothetical protein
MKPTAVPRTTYNMNIVRNPPTKNYVEGMTDWLKNVRNDGLTSDHKEGSSKSTQ